jgi:hypothetical protein
MSACVDGVTGWNPTVPIEDEVQTETGANQNPQGNQVVGV